MIVFDLSPELLDRMVDAAYAEYFVGNSELGKYASVEAARLDALSHLHHKLMAWKLEHWRNIIKAALQEVRAADLPSTTHDWDVMAPLGPDDHGPGSDF